MQKSKGGNLQNQLLNACVNGEGDLFEEVKKMRKHKPKVASSMDRNTEDIPGHFYQIYSNLYNEIQEENELESMNSKIKDSIDDSEINFIEKVTPEVAKKAALKLKNRNNDPYFKFASEFIKNGPDVLFQYLSFLIKCFLSHGQISLYSLIATIVPLIKNKLASHNKSSNYRSV